MPESQKYRKTMFRVKLFIQMNEQKSKDTKRVLQLNEKEKELQLIV